MDLNVCFNKTQSSTPPGGVLSIELVGLVSIQAWCDVMKQAGQVRDVYAICLRLDRALLTFGYESMMTAVSQYKVVNPLSCALVVNTEILEMAQAFAKAMAEAGVVRAVFTDVDAALAFAARQARLYQAMKAHSLLSSAPSRHRLGAFVGHRGWHQTSRPSPAPWANMTQKLQVT